MSNISSNGVTPGQKDDFPYFSLPCPFPPSHVAITNPARSLRTSQLRPRTEPQPKLILVHLNHQIFYPARTLFVLFRQKKPLTKPATNVTKIRDTVPSTPKSGGKEVPLVANEAYLALSDGVVRRPATNAA